MSGADYRTVREAAGLTIRDLVRLTGIVLPTIVALENGQAASKPSTLCKIRSALELALL